MFNMDSDLDEDILVESIDEIESMYNQSKSTDDLSDYEFALKLSQQLNRDNCHLLHNNELDSDIKKTEADKIDCDYLFALKLSHKDFFSKQIPKKLMDKSQNVITHSNKTISMVERNRLNFEETDTDITDSDYLLALQLSQDEVPSKSTHEKSLEKPQNVNMYLNNTLSVVDPSWETIDPNPDIYALFTAFNQRFFWKRLDMVEVKWSPRMTLCAGICSYQSRAGHCVVKLSKPLLQYRPRKDTIETLLHEMIHAYLFVTKNDREREDHGPQFHSHMFRINKESGAHITVYHNFHEEVKLYQTHWWKCNGPCQAIPPFYGLVKRSMNRAPGPNDNWWNDHRATCNGTFIKIKEPENYGKKSSADKNIASKVKEVKTSNIENYFSPNKLKSSAESSFSSHTNIPSKSTNNSFAKALPETGNKRIFTLSDLSKNSNKRSSPTKSPKKWAPLPGQRNILQFINKS